MFPAVPFKFWNQVFSSRFGISWATNFINARHPMSHRHTTVLGGGTCCVTIASTKWGVQYQGAWWFVVNIVGNIMAS